MSLQTGMEGVVPQDEYKISFITILTLLKLITMHQNGSVWRV